MSSNPTIAAEDYGGVEKEEVVYPYSAELYAKGHDITPRYPKLDFGPIQTKPKDWYENNTAVTEFLHALSLVFPQGEKFFVQSVAHYSKLITEESLKKQVRAFTAQETQHSAQHWAFNKRIGQEFGHSATVEEIDQLVKTIFKKARQIAVGDPDMQALAATCALEHWTAMLANALLNSPQGVRTLNKMPLPYRQLWTWHAVEEIEHKAVAFDVYKAVGGSYMMRVRTFLVTSYLFPFYIGYILVKLLRNRGVLWKLGAWWSLFKFIFISPGLFFLIARPWLSYLRPSFHPWDERNAELIPRYVALSGAQPSKASGPSPKPYGVNEPPRGRSEMSYAPPADLEEDVVLAKERLGFDQIDVA